MGSLASADSVISFGSIRPVLPSPPSLGDCGGDRINMVSENAGGSLSYTPGFMREVKRERGSEALSCTPYVAVSMN